VDLTPLMAEEIVFVVIFRPFSKSLPTKSSNVGSKLDHCILLKSCAN
jgi:hypothetical protein